MEKLLNRLNQLSAAWKAQFEDPEYLKHLPKGIRMPNLPLKWTMDDAGMLYIDGIWVCFADQVSPTIYRDEDFVSLVSMEFDLKGCTVSIIISDVYGDYEITRIDRIIHARPVQR